MRNLMLVLSTAAAALCAYSGTIHAMNQQWGWALLMLILFGLNFDSVLRNLRR